MFDKELTLEILKQTLKINYKIVGQKIEITSNK